MIIINLCFNPNKYLNQVVITSLHVCSLFVFELLHYNINFRRQLLFHICVSVQHLKFELLLR